MGYGMDCRHFKLIASGRIVHVVFVCDDVEQILLHVVAFEIKNSRFFQRIHSSPLPFEV